MQCGYLEVPRVIPIAAVLMLASAGEAPADPLPCRSVPPVLEATSLSDLSDLWFGSTDYRFAIMLAIELSNVMMFALVVGFLCPHLVPFPRD